MSDRIVFLDIDGVLCSPRAALALGDYGIIRTFDPVAVSFLNRLHEAAQFEIVVTSTWRKEGSIPLVLAASGVLAPCAKDWRTEDLRERDSADARPAEIDDWIARNAFAGEFVIIDDDEFNWTPRQADRWARCDCHDGIPLSAMQKALDVFGVRWPQASR